MARIQTRRWLIAMALALAAQPASSQINGEDLQNRCQNNRSEIARLQRELRLYTQHANWSPEGIARARTALVSARREVGVMRSVQPRLPAYLLNPQRNDPQDEELDRDWRDYVQSAERVRQAALPFGVICRQRDWYCSLNIPEALGREIDKAVAGQQPQQLLPGQIERHRTNLAALQCDRPATGYGLADPYGSRWSESEGGWSGDWVRRGNSNTYDASWGGGSIRAVLTISISGNRVSVSRQGATDGNNCQYEGTLQGSSVSGTYSCTSGGGQWSATIR